VVEPVELVESDDSVEPVEPVELAAPPQDPPELHAASSAAPAPAPARANSRRRPISVERSKASPRSWSSVVVMVPRMGRPAESFLGAG
jgi:hypothetical protein